MKKYGTDKPDLRNPLVIDDLTDIFGREDVTFDIFSVFVAFILQGTNTLQKQTSRKHYKHLTKSLQHTLPKH